jgi:ABC-type phosphate transport system auxiliary subunit
MVYDGQNQDYTKFAKEFVGSLGAFSTVNQWFVENLAKQLQQKFLLVEQLQKKIHKTEQTVQNRMSRDFEHIRKNDKQQIQQLWANFDELQRNSRFNQGLITQHVELIKQLQARLELTKGTSVDISGF